jgi:prophage antirepressor-like protein
MSNKLILVHKGEFGRAVCDFWLDTETQDILVTREQIGYALEYSNPKVAIRNIHDRNKERLDKFSTVLNMSTEGKTRKKYLYTTKGIYEICRLSSQPKANEFMDWTWDVLEDIRKNGYAQRDSMPLFIAPLNITEEEIKKLVETMPKGLTSMQEFDWYYSHVEVPYDKRLDKEFTAYCKKHGLII